MKWTFVILIFAFLFVLTPFLFWRATWFGRPMSNGELARALQDTSNPQDIQHGLSLVADRIIQGDSSVKQIYPEVMKLAASPSNPIRTMAAWVMGQDNTSIEFHQELLKLIKDPNPMVQRNAALALVRFHDLNGHDIIVAMLSPMKITAPASGVLRGHVSAGDSVNPGTEIAEIDAGGKKADMNSQVSGKMERWLVSDGARVDAQQPIAVILPSDDMVWEALRALYLIGQPADLPAIAPYARGGEDLTGKIAEQARLTMEEIQGRAGDSNAAPNPQ